MKAVKQLNELCPALWIGYLSVVLWRWVWVHLSLELQGKPDLFHGTK